MKNAMMFAFLASALLRAQAPPPPEPKFDVTPEVVLPTADDRGEIKPYRTTVTALNAPATTALKQENCKSVWLKDESGTTFFQPEDVKDTSSRSFYLVLKTRDAATYGIYCSTVETADPKDASKKVNGPPDPKVARPLVTFAVVDSDADPKYLAYQQKRLRAQHAGDFRKLTERLALIEAKLGTSDSSVEQRIQVSQQAAKQYTDTEVAKLQTQINDRVTKSELSAAESRLNQAIEAAKNSIQTDVTALTTRVGQNEGKMEQAAAANADTFRALQREGESKKRVALFWKRPKQPKTVTETLKRSADSLDRLKGSSPPPPAQSTTGLIRRDPPGQVVGVKKQ